MKVVHSFTSKTCGEDRFKIQMWYFILSCLYAKESGFDISLHTDNKTSNVLEMCPYDEIILDLEDKSSPANNKIWAWGKFESMKSEPLGTIHIDGDVFLKDSKLVDLMNFDNYDCIVQNLETPYWTNGDAKDAYGIFRNWNYQHKCFRDCVYPEWAKRQTNSMFNCGIVGFNNQQLKDEYYKTYWDMVYQYARSGVDINAVPDLIIEQQFLKDLTDYKNYKVKTLLNGDLFCCAKDIGYQHVLGKGKESNLETVKELVKKHNLEIYNKMLKIWEN